MDTEDFDWDIDPENLRILTEKYKNEEFPLFMDNIPEDVSNNPHLEALQALVYDENSSKYELALQFKDHGNELFGEGAKNRRRYFDAISAYTKGLEVNCDDNKLVSLLYANRSHCHLMTRNYVECVNDARKSINFDPKNVKAYYRAGRASLELELYDQSSRFCNGGLRVQPGNAALSSLLKESTARLNAQKEAKKKAEEVDMAKRQVGKEGLQKILKRRRIEYSDDTVYDFAKASTDMCIKLHNSDEDVLMWPILFLYDESNQSDMVVAHDERVSLKEQMELMLGPNNYPAWDRSKYYSVDTVDVYYEGEPNPSEWELVENTHTSLREILDSRKKKLVRRFLVFHIVPKGYQLLMEE